MTKETTENTTVDNDNWMRKTWRPAVGVTYIVINVADFIVFPVLWAIAQALLGKDLVQWEPLTLQASGLFHLSYGAILGVAAWSRGQEKIAGVSDK